MIGRVSKGTIEQTGWLGCFFLAYVSSFYLSGRFPAGLGLDPSWQAVLEYAVEHHFHFGREITFSYGPLGFLKASFSQGHLIGARVAFAFWCSGVTALSAVALARRMSGWARYAFLAWLIAFPIDIYADHQEFFVMAYGTVLLLSYEGRQRWQVPVFLLVFIVLALIKFTFLMAAVASLGIIAGVKTLQKRTGEGVLLSAALSLGFVAFWLALGQTLTDLPHWIRQGLDMSLGYSAAMSSVPQASVLLACVASLFLFFVALALVIKKVTVSLPQTGILLTVMLYVFLACKEGFVRADLHVFTFIWFLPLAFGFLYLRDILGALPFPSRLLMTGLYTGVMVLNLAAYSRQPSLLVWRLADWPSRMIENLGIIGNTLFGKAEDEFAIRRYPENTWEPVLARTRREVGDESVDVFNFLQWAALANGMNYHPRPMFQGCTAYTPYLQGLNEAYFRSSNPPHFVLFNQQTIDERFPTLDDSAALNYVLNNYVPVARDGAFLILRHATTEEISFQLVHEQILRFGEELDVSPWARAPLFMSASMPPSLFGRFIALAYQSRPLYIRVVRPSAQERYRFVPIMAERPFLLSPLLQNNDDVLDLYGAFPGKVLHHVIFEKPKRVSMQLRDTFTVRLYTAPGFLRSVRDKLDRRALAALKGVAF
jgi:hypothetical protein